MKIVCKLTAIILSIAVCNAENIIQDRLGSLKNEPSPQRFYYFDTDLLQERVKADSSNVVISPASIKALMAMILEGSGGQSAEQLRQALRTEESQDNYRMQLNAFLKSLKDYTQGYTVVFGNRMYVSNTVEPRREYKEALNKFYLADVKQIDFSSSHMAATVINSWVNEQTHGFINRLVEPDILSPYSKILLMNALYFKGKWKVPFDPDVTTIKKFFPEDGVCHKAYYMEILSSYPYAYIEELNALALALPYEGNKYSMLLLLPNDPKGIHQLVRDLPYSPLHNIISKLVKTEVLVSIPRFKIEYSTDLVASLSNLGIQDIFGSKANLSRMLTNREPNFITSVFHKAKIEVSEEGTTAGAGSGAIAVPLMGKTFPKFHPNRPFLFFIFDVEIGSILFEGRVIMPELWSRTCSDLKPDQQIPVQVMHSFNQESNTSKTSKTGGERQHIQNHQLHEERPNVSGMDPPHNQRKSDRDSIQFSNNS